MNEAADSTACDTDSRSVFLLTDSMMRQSDPISLPKAPCSNYSQYAAAFADNEVPAGGCYFSTSGNMNAISTQISNPCSTCPSCSPAPAACNNCLGFTGTNSRALTLSGSPTATCSTDEEFTTEYNLPITVTKVDPVTKVVLDTKIIAFTSTYDCAGAGTCDYSVPYDCTYDNTCTNSKWIDCDGGKDKTCGFTVQDMTLSATSIKLQNKSLNGGNYSSISLQQACPFTMQTDTGNESEVELKGTAGTLSLAEPATAACTCAYDTASSCNFQANHSIPITVTKAVTSAGTTEVDTQTIAFTSSYSCNDNGTCGHSVPYTCLTGKACSAFTVQDMTLTGNTLTLTQTSSDGSNTTTTPETFTLSSCWQ